MMKKTGGLKSRWTVPLNGLYLSDSGTDRKGVFFYTDPMR